MKHYKNKISKLICVALIAAFAFEVLTLLITSIISIIYGTYFDLIFFSLINFIPAAILFLIFKIYNGTKEEKHWKDILSVILAILMFIFSIFSEMFCIISNMLVFSLSNKHPVKIIYSTVIKNYQKGYYGYKHYHFPSTLPKNAKNYKLTLESSFHGEDINTLKLTIDKNYILKTIEENKDNISQEIKFSKINEYYNYINEIKIKDKENAMVYILKQKNNDSSYTSGFITSLNNNEILFFSSTFDLRNFK